jgi:hypothetical protein
MRGRIRFWLSTLADQDLPAQDPAAFDRWLDEAIADLEGTGGRALGLWDSVILGNAYSRKLDNAPEGADTGAMLAKATAAFEGALADPAFATLVEYRRRLTFDGYVLVLERAMGRVRRDPFLAGSGPQPGEPGYDRDRLADLVFAAFSLASRREEVRKRAEGLGLVKDGTDWSLDTPGDYYWGFTAAQAGALLRIEDGANGTATECDRAAAHPQDVERSTRPVGYSAIDVDRVLAACQGDDPREMFNRARALAKRGDSDAEIVNLLIPAAKAGLPIAYNNLAIMIGSLAPDFVTSAELLTTFSSLGLVKAYPELSELLRQRLTDGKRRETFKWLAAKAAALDVPEAHRDLAELSSDDPLVRGLHLAIAEELFNEAGRHDEADAAGTALAALNLSSDDVQWVQTKVKEREPTKLVVVDETLASRLLSLW